jgi:single-stranded DNA-binding protein
MLTINEVFLFGSLARDPQLLGESTVAARLCVTEAGPNGQTYRTFIPLEAWGKAAESLRPLCQGQSVLIRGKLKWRAGERDGQKGGELVVLVWSLQVEQPASTAGFGAHEAAMAGRN